MDNITKLNNMCIRSLTIEVNPHKKVLPELCPVKDWLAILLKETIEDTDSETFYEILKRNELVLIRCHPKYHVSFYEIMDYDLSRALQRMVDIIEEELNDK